MAGFVSGLENIGSGLQGLINNPIVKSLIPAVVGGAGAALATPRGAGTKAEVGNALQGGAAGYTQGQQTQMEQQRLQSDLEYRKVVEQQAQQTMALTQIDLNKAKASKANWDSLPEATKKSYNNDQDLYDNVQNTVISQKLINGRLGPAAKQMLIGALNTPAGRILLKGQTAASINAMDPELAANWQKHFMDFNSEYAIEAPKNAIEAKQLQIQMQQAGLESKRINQEMQDKALDIQAKRSRIAAYDNAPDKAMFPDAETWAATHAALASKKLETEQEAAPLRESLSSLAATPEGKKFFGDSLPKDTIGKLDSKTATGWLEKYAESRAKETATLDAASRVKDIGATISEMTPGGGTKSTTYRVAGIDPDDTVHYHYTGWGKVENHPDVTFKVPNAHEFSAAAASGALDQPPPDVVSRATDAGLKFDSRRIGTDGKPYWVFLGSDGKVAARIPTD